jgi:hypothetical protein
VGRIREIKIIGHDYELSTYVDDDDYRTFDLGSYNWSRLIGRTTTYAKTYKNHKTVLLHRLIMGLETSPKSICVDHIDHNGLNNSRTNLRITDSAGNHHNSRKSLSGRLTSSYKGVRFNFDNNKNPWTAHITLSGEWKYLGCYRTQEEAATAYNKAAIELFGLMAHLNIIGPT